jgi:DNA-binding response OmpR family regulator
MDYANNSLLVVDDDELSRDLLSRHLERQGYTVATAGNGAEALRCMAVESYDLVLLDLQMPEVDGYGVLESMRREEQLRGTPVIMLTAVSERDAVLTCLTLGAADYIVKPFSVAVVKSRVWRCLETRRLSGRAMTIADLGAVAGSVVMVVDDEEMNRRLVSARVRQLGAEAVEAQSGRDALSQIRRCAPDLVLLDLMMPGMDGFEVLQKMKDSPRLAQVPVIVVSGNADSQSTARCMDLGADDYLGKPYNAVEFKARVVSCLQLKRLRDEEADRSRRLGELADFGRGLRGLQAEE